MWVMTQAVGMKHQEGGPMLSAGGADEGDCPEKYLRFFWQNGSSDSCFRASGTCVLSELDCSLLSPLSMTIATFFIGSSHFKLIIHGFAY